MALLFNNLILNKTSQKYMPFLFNLISGRRRLLSENEFKLVCLMLDKNGNYADFCEEAMGLFFKLTSEKQFVTDDSRALVEKSLSDAGHFRFPNKYSDDLSFSVELTRGCNMKCSYCYVASRRNDNIHMSRKHIDAIYDFFTIFVDDSHKISDTPTIRVTGGEPLLNDKTVEIINYLASKWPNSKLDLLTNGVNLLKFYDGLPFDRINEIHISLDGIKDIHMGIRFSGMDVNPSIYDDIIIGIKRLLHDNVKVKIRIGIDKNNYRFYADLMTFLREEGVVDSPLFSQGTGFALDFRNSLDIDESFHNKNNIVEIQQYFTDLGIPPPSYLSLSTLAKAIFRPKNTPFIPEHQRCNSTFLAKYYFSCDGDIYHCDCVHEGDGVLGTYYPSVSINSSATDKLLKRSVMTSEKCKACAYKFVCLGGCPMAARAKGVDMYCGAFADDEIMDNLEYNHNWIN